MAGTRPACHEKKLDGEACRLPISVKHYRAGNCDANDGFHRANKNWADSAQIAVLAAIFCR
jgi:hypothetical protein